MADDETVIQVWFSTVGSVRKALADEGLFIITAEQKAVLDAASRPWRETGLDYTFEDWSKAVWRYELARREAKP